MVNEFSCCWYILVGEANISELFEGPVWSRTIKPKGKVAAYFQRSFLTRYNLANSTNECTLDVFLTDFEIYVLVIAAMPPGIASSDHGVLVARLGITKYERSKDPVQWKLKREADWEACAHEIEEPLQVWHEWLSGRLNTQTVQYELLEAYMLLFFILLCTFQQQNSPYGKFATSWNSAKTTHWLDSECVQARRVL